MLHPKHQLLLIKNSKTQEILHLYFLCSFQVFFMWHFTFWCVKFRVCITLINLCIWNLRIVLRQLTDSMCILGDTELLSAVKHCVSSGVTSTATELSFCGKWLLCLTVLTNWNLNTNTIFYFPCLSYSLQNRRSSLHTDPWLSFSILFLIKKKIIFQLRLIYLLIH